MSLSSSIPEIKSDQTENTKAINQLIQDVIDAKPMAEVKLTVKLLRQENGKIVKATTPEENKIFDQWVTKLKKEIDEAAEGKKKITAGYYLALAHIQEWLYEDYSACWGNLEKAAALNHPAAKYCLGTRHLFSLLEYSPPGFTPDPDKGYKLLIEASLAGNAYASTSLGMYWQRKGKYEIAAECYQQAIDADQYALLVVPRGQLANLCEHGLGVPKNLVRTVELYRQCIEQFRSPGDATHLIRLFEQHYPVKETVLKSIYHYFTPPNTLDPMALYHIVLCLIYLDSTPEALKSRLKNEFKKMANQNPGVILRGLKKDPWEKVQPLLPAELVSKIDASRKESKDESKDQEVVVVKAAAAPVSVSDFTAIQQPSTLRAPRLLATQSDDSEQSYTFFV